MDTGGCAPGTGVDWSVGKNIETVQFVRLAEICLPMMKGDAAVIAEFRKYIDRVKRGEIEISVHLPLPSELHDFFGG